MPGERGASGVSAGEPNVRIIIKKARHGGGHHGGAWKVAYADFVTTMMALFIVLWIVGQNPAVKQGVSQYFRNPGLFKDSATSSAVQGGAGLLPGASAEAASPPERKTAEDVEEERLLQDAAKRSRALIEKGGALETLRDQVKIEVTPDGLRIELMERENSPFFRVGSAVPIDQLNPLRENLAKTIGTLPNPITVEGPTDGRQYSDRKNYSNWELSTDRANMARRIIEASGLAAGRIDRVVGHADLLLRVPEDPLGASNRRITFLVRRQGG